MTSVKRSLDDNILTQSLDLPSLNHSAFTVPSATNATQRFAEDVVTFYPTGAQFVLITISLCLCVFLVGLDATILATAVPSITNEFHSIQDVGWYDAAFRLTSCMAQLSQGKLFDNYSTKRVFFFNMVLFELGIIVSGTAINSSVFIVGRAITGLGFSGIAQGCMVIIAASTQLKSRALYLGFISASEFLAISAAPILGGALTSRLGWRWCFYINLPAAAAPAALLLILKLPSSISRNDSMCRLQKLKQLDPVGLLCLMPAVLCLLLALQWGGNQYMWSNARIITLLIIAPTMFAGFCYSQHHRKDAAMLPTRIIKQYPIVLSCIFSSCLAASQAIILYYISIWFQAVKGASALQSGVNTLPLVVAILIFAVLSGYIISRSGSYTKIMIPSSIFVVGGSIGMMFLRPTSSSILWATPLALFGIGAGSGISTPFIAAQSVLGSEDISMGMALMTFSQDIGEAIFITIAQVIFLNKLESSLRIMLPNVPPRSIISLGAANLSDKLSPDVLTPTLAAYNTAIQSTFYLATGLAVLILIAACLMQGKGNNIRRQA